MKSIQHPFPLHYQFSITRKMPWFPIGRNDETGWRLDVVSLLAILGESLMSRHVQSLSASKLCLLPRLIPAPQAFLRSSRQVRLPSPAAIVCGVYSGTLVHELNYFADIIHPLGGMSAYQVVVYNITWAGVKRSPKKWYVKGQQHRREALVPPRMLSPVNMLTVVSFLLTLAAFIWAIVIHDGAAAVALVAMSCASTLIGIGSHWRPQLAARMSEAPVPEGDVVIRTREGAFVIIQCCEEVARELYMGPEECNYLVDDHWSKVLVGFGTLLVIGSVIFLGNCNWTMKVVITGIYIILNTLYWAASLLPREWLWDLSRYDCKDVTPGHLRAADKPKQGDDAPSYTRSLWYAIQATGEVSWVTISGAAPKTTAWKRWLRLAHANCGNRDWDAIGEKDRLMLEARPRRSLSKPCHQVQASDVSPC